MALRYYLDQTKNIFDPSESIGTLQRLRRETIQMGETGLHLLATSHLRSRQAQFDRQASFDAVAILRPLVERTETDSADARALRILAITRQRCGCKHFLSHGPLADDVVSYIGQVLNVSLPDLGALRAYKASGFRQALGLALNCELARTEEALTALGKAKPASDFPETISYPALGLANELAACGDLDLSYQAIMRIVKVLDPGWHYPHICAVQNRVRAALPCKGSSHLDEAIADCRGALTAMPGHSQTRLQTVDSIAGAADWEHMQPTYAELTRYATTTPIQGVVYCASYMAVVMECVKDGRAPWEALGLCLRTALPGFGPPDDGFAGWRPQ